MATLAMPPRKLATSRKLPEASPRDIIASARSAPAGMGGALVASGLSAVLMWAAFTPVDFGPLGWVCLVPLLLLARLARPTHRMYRAAYLGGLGFWLVTLQWMRLGHFSMHLALAALAGYLALYFPAFLALTRVAVWRLRIPLTIAAPIVWTGLELLRGHLMTGFCWYDLGHSQYRWLDLIQISDITGAYGVTFLLVLVAACVAELVPVSVFARLHLLPPQVDESSVKSPGTLGRWWRPIVCLGVFGAVLAYGSARRGGSEFQPGPRVALIQGNFTSDVKHKPDDWMQIQVEHERLTGIAVQQQPDLIVWPETMFRWPLLETPLDVADEELERKHPNVPFTRLRDLQVRRKLAQMGQMAGTAMVIGLETIAVDLQHVRTFNSAVLVRPDGVIGARYDKLHRVPFGEYVPLADTLPALRALTPYGSDFGIDAGTGAAAFEIEKYRFAPIICFEDTIPHLVQSLLQATTGVSMTAAAGSEPKRVDFLVNLTNDGWFHGSSELDQHLITAAFRCVECRTPMVRAVNTGISAIIDGDGAIRRRAEGLRTGKSKQEEAVLVDNVPLDPRTSLYLAGGDWFAGSCLAFCGFVSLTGLLGRLTNRKKEGTA